MPKAVARCVFPVPDGPTMRMFSRRSRCSPFTSSSNCGLLTLGRPSSEKSRTGPSARCSTTERMLSESEKPMSRTYSPPAVTSSRLNRSRSLKTRMNDRVPDVGSSDSILLRSGAKQSGSFHCSKGFAWSKPPGLRSRIAR